MEQGRNSGSNICNIDNFIGRSMFYTPSHEYQRNMRIIRCPSTMCCTGRTWSSIIPLWFCDNLDGTAAFTIVPIDNLFTDFCWHHHVLTAFHIHNVSHTILMSQHFDNGFLYFFFVKIRFFNCSIVQVDLVIQKTYN
ncbi:Uncharacterised protein [Mycobacterium tuberculosis]|nr:Uncharacterised protein [Mycobacterium tuberculosis]